MTEAEVRRIVAEMLGIDPEDAPIGMCKLSGAISYKMLGNLVGKAGLHQRFVLVDFQGVSRIGGEKVWWLT